MVFFNSNDITGLLNSPIFIITIFIITISILSIRFKIFKKLENTIRPSYIMIFIMQTFFILFSNIFSSFRNFFMFFKDKNQVLNYCNDLSKNNGFKKFFKPLIELFMNFIHVFASSQNISLICYILGIIIFTILLAYIFIELLRFCYKFQKRPINVFFWLAIGVFYSWNIYNLIKGYFCSLDNCSNNSILEWMKTLINTSVQTENSTVFIEWMITAIPAILIFLSVLYFVYLLKNRLFTFENEKSVEKNLKKYNPDSTLIK